MDPEVELSVREIYSERQSRTARELLLIGQQDAIMQHFTDGHITALEAIDLCRPVVHELRRLQPRHDIPFMDGRIEHTDAAALDADCMPFREWVSVWQGAWPE